MSARIWSWWSDRQRISATDTDESVETVNLKITAQKRGWTYSQQCKLNLITTSRLLPISLSIAAAMQFLGSSIKAVIPANDVTHTKKRHLSVYVQTAASWVSTVGVFSYQCRCGSVCDTAAGSLCSTHTTLLHQRHTHPVAPTPADTGRDTHTPDQSVKHKLFLIFTYTQTQKTWWWEIKYN